MSIIPFDMYFHIALPVALCIIVFLFAWAWTDFLWALSIFALMLTVHAFVISFYWTVADENRLSVIWAGHGLMCLFASVIWSIQANKTPGRRAYEQEVVSRRRPVVFDEDELR